ncbi:glycoside hydrolase family 65 protein [Lapidilactobacillus mulanensis]|uniref:Glycoside hydrolase family 65 protein n=1 Tax=Lapidilactobacillus mulanensis TaxID=2485999 RepID=A0ABW4DPB9_9LACO|nr:glycosyl hydrolase family 65 protein [Lapidilactobacillus mulanensis]
MTNNDWQIVYTNLPKGVESYGQESLLTLSNGYLGWRGAPVMSTFTDDNYPGLYVAGVFNQTSTPVAGKAVINEDMVNLPNPQLIKIAIDGKIVDFQPSTRRAVLNMKDGTLTETYEFKLAQGLLTLTSVKALDPVHYHQLAEQLTITADFSAKITVTGVIDGTVTNQNVKRYRDFNSQEFEVVSTRDHYLHAKTLASKLDLVVGATLTSDAAETNTDYQKQQVVDTIEADLTAGQPLVVDRVMAVATSYENEMPFEIVNSALAHTTFAEVLKASQDYWQEVWSTNDIELKSSTKDLQMLVRMNIFHLHQAAQHNANRDLDASVGSRALTGEGYRGHIFWDELFVVPYYAANEPATAYDILQYRLKRLEAAKKNAASENEAGAMYPWQSGMYGDEQAQIIHLNPVDNSWIPDNSRLQRHVSLAVAYDMWIYTHFTNDYRLLNNGGLAVLLETSKFWLNKVTEQNGKYHLAGVMGPDEFHEAYPGSSESGVKDNAYTNIMLAWSLNWLLELQNQSEVDFAKVASENDFSADLIAKAKDVAKNLTLHLNNQGVVEQYDGYFQLKELDFKAYTEKYGDIHRVDRLLKAEGKDSNDYQANKQADFLMLMYNLGDHVTHDLITNQLGYQLPENWLALNRDYYLARTVHGSTTSRPVFAGIDIALGQTKRAAEFLEMSIKSDYDDIQGGTTAEGIHIGVMGETLAVIQNGFAGVNLRDTEVTVNPQLPAGWESLKFSQRFKNVLLNFEFTQKNVMIKADHDSSVLVLGRAVNLKAGVSQVISI